jgi:hypothetical protein
MGNQTLLVDATKIEVGETQRRAIETLIRDFYSKPYTVNSTKQCITTGKSLLRANNGCAKFLSDKKHYKQRGDDRYVTSEDAEKCGCSHNDFSLIGKYMELVFSGVCYDYGRIYMSEIKEEKGPKTIEGKIIAQTQTLFEKAPEGDSVQALLDLSDEACSSYLKDSYNWKTVVRHFASGKTWVGKEIQRTDKCHNFENLARSLLNTNKTTIMENGAFFVGLEDITDTVEN